MIEISSSKPYWNYFLALERDVENVARYIEFAQPNFEVFSIELAHLLFAASSEVDVVCKALCETISPHARREGINAYREILKTSLPRYVQTELAIRVEGMVARPEVSKGREQEPQAD